MCPERRVPAGDPAAGDPDDGVDGAQRAHAVHGRHLHRRRGALLRVHAGTLYAGGIEGAG